MYLSFFDLKQDPFSITPDPEFVYLSEQHQESLAHLIYGITRGGGAGFVQLTGEVGTGKTTISRLFLQKLPEDTQAALILNPNITPIELLENIFKEFKLSTRGIKGKLNAMVDRLNEQLLHWWSEGKNNVVIIDEAQNIPRDTLEQLRLLTNLETDQHKLLQIILIGQPELKQTMQRKDLRQLAQRITARFHLQPLSRQETAAYIRHRLGVSGGNKDSFSAKAVQLIHDHTQGVPRLINVLCDRSLLVAFTRESKQINHNHVRQAITEINPEQPVSEKPRLIWLAAAVMVVVLGAWFWPKSTPEPKPDIIDTPTAKPTVQDWPDARRSWQAYMDLWEPNHQIDWSQPQCPPVNLTGMGCLRRLGNINQIKRQNTPVMLVMDGTKVALLQSLADNQITLLTQTGPQNLPSEILNDQWYGEYFVLWPLADALIDDTINPAVDDWAAEVITVIDPERVSLPLEVWIKNFQQQNGLLADGIIGKETQMTLSLQAYHGPKLTE